MEGGCFKDVLFYFLIFNILVLSVAEKTRGVGKKRDGRFYSCLFEKKRILMCDKMAYCGLLSGCRWKMVCFVSLGKMVYF